MLRTCTTPGATSATMPSTTTAKPAPSRLPMLQFLTSARPRSSHPGRRNHCCFDHHKTPECEICAGENARKTGLRPPPRPYRDELIGPGGQPVGHLAGGDLADHGLRAAVGEG